MEEWLKEIGAVRYESSDNIFPYSDYFYQLKVQDETGIAYFVEFVHYAGNESLSESWMARTDFSARRYEISYVHEYSSEVYKNVLAEIRGIWIALGKPYYELRIPATQ